MKLMRLVKSLALALAGLLYSSISYAAPIKLLWDEVNLYENGSPIKDLVVYRIYKSTGNNYSFQPIYDTKHTYYEWLTPALGKVHYFKVTAIVKGIESLPSAPIKVTREYIWRYKPSTTDSVKKK